MFELRLACCLLFLATFISSGTACAGALLSLGAHWNNFAFEPVNAGDAVANFYGVGGELNAGYSLSRIFNASLWGSYTPASQYNVEVGKEDAVLWAYGGKLGFNIWDSVYLNFHGGQYTYELIFNERATELDDQWSGFGGGLGLGGIFPGKNKEGYWTLGVSFTQGMMKLVEPEPEADNSTRKLDVFAVSLSYIFASKSRGSGFGFFDDFLKSIF